jgi:hypothetical protein
MSRSNPRSHSPRLTELATRTISLSEEADPITSLRVTIAHSLHEYLTFVPIPHPFDAFYLLNDHLILLDCSSSNLTKNPKLDGEEPFSCYVLVNQRLASNRARILSEQTLLKDSAPEVLTLPQSLQSLLRDCLHINAANLDKLDSQQRRGRIELVVAMSKELKDKGLEYLTDRKNYIDLRDKKHVEAFLVHKGRVEANKLLDAAMREKLLKVAEKNRELKDKLTRARLLLRGEEAVERLKMQREEYVESESNSRCCEELAERIRSGVGQWSWRDRQAELMNSITGELLVRRQISHQKLRELYCTNKVGRTASVGSLCSLREYFRENGSKHSRNS